MLKSFGMVYVKLNATWFFRQTFVKKIKSKYYNHGHDVLRLFLFIFEQNVIVSNKHGVQVASRVSKRLKKKDLRKVGNIKK